MILVLTSDDIRTDKLGVLDKDLRVFDFATHDEAVIRVCSVIIYLPVGCSGSDYYILKSRYTISDTKRLIKLKLNL